MKLIDFLEPLTCNSKLTEEYAYNNFGDFVVIDGSTMNDYKLKIKTFDYDGISICVTTAGIYAGNVSIFKGKFSVGNNVKCYFLRKKFKKINLDYLVVHLSLIAEKCLTGKSGDYSSLNISMFENEILGVILPDKVALQIVECEPAVKGDTATSASKNAKLESGLEIKVPLFINQDEMVLVNTSDGKYSGRAKD